MRVKVKLGLFFFFEKGEMAGVKMAPFLLRGRGGREVIIFSVHQVGHVLLTIFILVLKVWRVPISLRYPVTLFDGEIAPTKFAPIKG